MNHISERKGYSLFNVNQAAEYSQTLDDLYERAEQVHPQFVEKIIQLEKETGGTAVIPHIKGRNRSYMKALFKYRDGTPNGALQISPELPCFFRDSLDLTLSLFRNKFNRSCVASAYGHTTRNTSI